MSELQLEVGKSYRNRKGEVREIKYYDPNNAPFIYKDSHGISYKCNGVYIYYTSSSDLIEEVDSLSESKASFERELEEYDFEREVDDDSPITFDEEQFYTALRAVGLGTYAYGDIHELIVLLQRTNGNPTLSQLQEVGSHDEQ